MSTYFHMDYSELRNMPLVLVLEYIKDLNKVLTSERAKNGM